MAPKWIKLNGKSRISLSTINVCRKAHCIERFSQLFTPKSALSRRNFCTFSWSTMLSSELNYFAHLGSHFSLIFRNWKIQKTEITSTRLDCWKGKERNLRPVRQVGEVGVAREFFFREKRGEVRENFWTESELRFDLFELSGSFELSTCTTFIPSFLPTFRHFVSSRSGSRRITSTDSPAPRVCSSSHHGIHCDGAACMWRPISSSTTVWWPRSCLTACSWPRASLSRRLNSSSWPSTLSRCSSKSLPKASQSTNTPTCATHGIGWTLLSSPAATPQWAWVIRNYD